MQETRVTYIEYPKSTLRPIMKIHTRELSSLYLSECFSFTLKNLPENNPASFLKKGVKIPFSTYAQAATIN